MISKLIGFYQHKTKETADYPSKDKVCLILEDREHVAECGKLFIDIDFDLSKVIFDKSVQGKFHTIDELKGSLDKNISIDYGTYNGKRYGKNCDRLL